MSSTAHSALFGDSANLTQSARSALLSARKDVWLILTKYQPNGNWGGNKDSKERRTKRSLRRLVKKCTSWTRRIVDLHKWKDIESRSRDILAPKSNSMGLSEPTKRKSKKKKAVNKNKKGLKMQQTPASEKAVPYQKETLKRRAFPLNTRRDSAKSKVTEEGKPRLKLNLSGILMRWKYKVTCCEDPGFGLRWRDQCCPKTVCRDERNNAFDHPPPRRI